jgi:hypothetical protein
MHRESRLYTRIIVEFNVMLRDWITVCICAGTAHYIHEALVLHADCKRYVSAFSHVFDGQLTTMTATTILCCPADKKRCF